MPMPRSRIHILIAAGFLSRLPRYIDEARRWLGNYHKLKEALEDICELNHALLRPDGAAPRRARKNP